MLYLISYNRSEFERDLGSSACKISNQWDDLKYQSRGFETSRDHTMRRLIVIETGPVVTDRNSWLPSINKAKLASLHTLWPSDSIWRQASGSILSQVMAWSRQATWTSIELSSVNHSRSWQIASLPASLPLCCPCLSISNRGVERRWPQNKTGVVHRYQATV